MNNLEEIVGIVERVAGGITVLIGSSARARIDDDCIFQVKQFGDYHVVAFLRGSASWEVLAYPQRDQATFEGFPPSVSRSLFLATEGTIADQQLLTAGRTLEGAAKAFTRSCECGHEYQNNCAHYLSNAFISVGFSQVGAPLECINARCPSRRPIRAREFWCWLKATSAHHTTDLQPNTGFWVGFQLNESAYWGGHVAIIDTHTNKFYGTGWYPDWDQHFYKL
jgi:hypothetical protein